MDKVCMTRPVPMTGCPVCGAERFVVTEFSGNTYLTGRDGDIVDAREDAYSCAGQCQKCGAVFSMMPTKAWKGFMPLTPVREIIFDMPSNPIAVLHYDDSVKSNNPMQKG